MGAGDRLGNRRRLVHLRFLWMIMAIKEQDEMDCTLGAEAKGFLSESFALAVGNVRTVGTFALMDAALLGICAAVFYLNVLLLIPMIADGSVAPPISYLLVCHGNDFIGGIAFMAYTNLLISFIKPEVRFKRLSAVIIFIFLCGIFWECAAPLFVEGSTGDMMDILAYDLGAILYWLILKALNKIYIVTGDQRG